MDPTLPAPSDTFVFPACPRERPAPCAASRLSVELPRVWVMAVPSLAQPSFDELGTHLSQVTFCVVDLETTG